jgi:hypothetical protein
VRRKRQQVDAERLDVHWDLARRLNRVGVEHGAARPGQPRQFGDWLNRPDLVVGVHHRHERCLIGQRLAQCVGRDDAALVDGQQRHLPAAAGERFQRIEHRFVLDAGGDEVPAVGDGQGLGRPADRKVVTLGAATRKHDF